MDPSNFFICSLLILFSISAAQQPTCWAGSYLLNGKCTLCPKGTYQNKRNSMKCIPCPHGTYNPFKGGETIDVCQECPVGTFQALTGATSQSACKRCPPGQSSPAGAPSCLSCPAGSYLSLCEKALPTETVFPFLGTCYTCGILPSGFVCSNYGQTKASCIECGPEETSGKNSLQCKSCPPGLFRSPGSETCVSRKCPAGFGIFDFENTGKCTYCYDYLVNDGSKGHCERCPPGTQGNQYTEATKCEQCPPDAFSTLFSSQCQKCPPGQSSKATGGVLCLPDDFGCPSNFFKDANGICQTCPLQTRYDEKMKKCIPCPKNHLSAGGISKECSPCPVNMVSPHEVTSINDLQCFCKPGFGLVEGSNGRSCKRCGEGTVSDGTTSCRLCPENTFASHKGSADCIPCPLRKIQPRRGSRSCISPKCDRGLIASPRGECVLPTTGCPPDSMREPDFSFPKRSTCVPYLCPSGTAFVKKQNFGSTYRSCGLCSTNQRYDPTNFWCNDCAENEFSEGGLSRECKKCPPGETYNAFYGRCGCFSSRQKKNGTCSKCPKGTRGLENVEGCIQCPLGTFSEKEGGTSCTKCPAGTFSDVEGSERCKTCPPGTSSFGTGNTKCS